MKEVMYQRQWQVMPVFEGVTLGVAMLVKDCASDLRWSIPGVWGADEIHVGDTGSSDDTMESAESYGATHVYGMEIEGDDFSFSEARNTLHAQMKTDWILVVDSDEWVGEEQMGVIKGLCQGTGVDWYWGYQRNACRKRGQGVFWQGTPHVRLFRRDSMGYEGHVHNQALPTRKDVVMREGGYEVLHFGYMNTLAQWERKVGPRLVAHEKLADMWPDKAQHQYHLLQSYVVLEKWELVKEQSEKVIEVVGRTSHWQNEFYKEAAMSALREAKGNLKEKSG